MSAAASQKGFTIIEVLIVIAIGAAILLIVLLALPAMQRNARNTQRKKDVGIVMTYIQEYILLNEGALPNSSCNNTEADCFLRDIKLSYYDNQSTTTNNVSLWNRFSIGPFNDESDPQLNPDDPISRERISIRTWSRCNGSLITGVNAQKQDIAAQYVLETFSGGSLHCIEM